MKFGIIYEICRPDPEWATEAEIYWQALEPVDLSEWTGELQIGASSTPDPVTLGDEAGTIAISLLPARTAELSVGKLHYYVKLTTGDNRVYFPLRGSLNMIAP